MIANTSSPPSIVIPLRRIVARSLGFTAWLWTCWWWAFRCHVAAIHGIPRSSLEPPPAKWLEPLAALPPTLPRRRVTF